MKEIIFYGRGGQGSVIASRLLAMAAFKEGKNVQSFPFFGVERRGAPVTAYTRLDNCAIRKRVPISEPDFVIVLDPTLLENVDITKGLKKSGCILINTKASENSFAFSAKFKVFAFDAAQIAAKHSLGSKSSPIVNTSMLGAFSRFTKEISIDSLAKVIRENIAIKTEDNIKAAKEAYEKAK
jgi:2-oxoacid:acceptor oxidoreductase gamma subunit (pyruvate/2-ketoisovalerate family)